MAWQDISTSYYKKTFNCAASIEADKNVFVTLQYSDNVEDGYLTPTKARFRFKLSSTGGSNYFDTFYILVGGSDGTLYPIKDEYKTDNWPYYSSGFNITKAADAETFKIPSYYLIDNGNNAAGVHINTVAKAYKAATNTRENYTCKLGSVSLNISAFKSKDTDEAIASEATPGAISISDNQNNTFTITAEKGKAGTNNPISYAMVDWGYSTDYGNSFTVSTTSGSITKALEIGTKANATRTVYVKNAPKTQFLVGPYRTASLKINQYVAPSKPGIPKLTYTKSRLTIKENWNCSWTPASNTNSTSPVDGYIVNVYKNSSKYYDFYSTTTQCYINPNEEGYEFKPGDKISVGIIAYAKDAKSNEYKSSESISEVYTVQHAGIVRPRVGNQWVEGQVKVRVNNAWVEAEVVKSRVNGAWVESQ